jgi:hypothetical protein
VNQAAAHTLHHDLAAVLRDEPERFAEAVRGLLDAPAPPARDDLLIALHALRADSKAQGYERRENLVLDMLDWIIGWCSPGSQPPFPRG